MTKAEKKIAALEKRVKELEERPQVMVLPVQVPVVYPTITNPWPWSPWANPTIICSTSGTSYVGGNSGIIATWSLPKDDGPEAGGVGAKL